ncbi:hypothetical protein DQM23_01640 [Lacticaseibacillus paracasei]|nr:hypothetical protein LPEG9_03600 [Lacticaseibacillus paracasei]MCT4394203.1 hypothetical protein [Lacticaseibacillus paracasei]RDF93999.1 hypothetical protein DQM23_01640 [Lacticaseibacillus paracasei]
MWGCRLSNIRQHANRAGSRSTITRSPAQQPACKDLGRNGQKATITSKGAYIPVANRAGSRSTITCSQSQKPAHKDLESKRPRSGHFDSSPLMLRLLSAPARAQL